MTTTSARCSSCKNHTLSMPSITADRCLFWQGKRLSKNPLPWKGRTDTAALRLIFEQALKHRKPYAILIDEAEHIAKAARGSKLLDQLDHLKSLAIMTQVVHVLGGHLRFDGVP